MDAGTGLIRLLEQVGRLEDPTIDARTPIEDQNPQTAAGPMSDRGHPFRGSIDSWSCTLWL
jgi:hypothetical protein